MIRYVITTAPGSDAANLSRRGDWGNVPHASTDAARKAAREDAGAEPFTIEQQAIRRPLRGN